MGAAGGTNERRCCQAAGRVSRTAAAGNHYATRCGWSVRNKRGLLWRFVLVVACLPTLAPAFVRSRSGVESSPSRANLSTDRPLAITLRIYNYAQISPALLRRSENEAAAILRQAGLRIGWLACPGRTRNWKLSSMPAGARLHGFCVLYPSARDGRTRL